MFPWLPASDHLDRTLALLGILGSILLTTFVILQIGRVVYVLVGVLTFLACLTWLVLRGRGSGRFRPSLSPSHSYLLAMSFFLLMIVSEGVLYTRPLLYERPLLYFLLLAISAGLIALQILLAERPSPGLILIQVIVLGLSIAWSQLLIFPDLVGADPWTHEFFTMRILSGHVVPPNEAYSSLPVFHLLIGVLSLLTGLSYKLAAILSVSLVQLTVDCTILYLMGRYLLSSSRVGLMASLMVIIANQHIFMSYWSIPNAFAAVFILAILFLLWRTGAGVSWEVRAVLLAIPMAALILTHSVSSMCMALVLIAVWGAYVVCRWLYPEMITSVKSPVPLAVPALFLGGMLGWWYFGTTLVRTLEDLISQGFSADFFITTPVDLLLKRISVPVGEQIFNNVGLFLFFALSFIGIFYLISTRRDDRIAFVAAGITPLLVGFLSLLAGYAVLYERWWFFSQILLAIPAGIGVMVICTRSFGGSLTLTVSASLLLVSALTFLLIMSPAANVDNHLFSENSMMTYSLTESELASMSTVSLYDTSIIRSDTYFSNTLVKKGIKTLPLNDTFYTGDLEGLASDTVLIRDVILSQPFLIHSSLIRLDYNLQNRMESLNFSRIFDDGTVQGYRRGI
jgi:hypothetical protein